MSWDGGKEKGERRGRGGGGNVYLVRGLSVMFGYALSG